MPVRAAGQGLTTYQVVVDRRSLFIGDPTGVRRTQLSDSPSSTFLVTEAASGVLWSKPEDLSLASPDPFLGMGSKHPGGFNAAMADGSVRFIQKAGPNAANPEMLKRS